MSLVLLSLITSFASAADLDDDGCEDSYADANSACVATSATLGSGVTVGADAVVAPYASVGADTAVAANAYIGNRATVVGRLNEATARPIGNGTVIGRRATIDADHDIGADNTIGRTVNAGLRLQTGSNVTIGYGATLGDDITIGAGAIVGNLVDMGDKTTVDASAVLARGVTISASDSASFIGGIIGPNVAIGADCDIDVTARIRRDAILGDDVTIESGVRIAQDAIIGDGVTIGANARIGAGAEVTATTIVEPGAIILRGETLDDPAIVSQHNTIAFSPTHTADGCSYLDTDQIPYQNLGSMDWKSCMSAAAQRGAAVSSNVYTNVGTGSNSGWMAHRNGSNAMYVGSYTGEYFQSISTNRTCVVAGDNRSGGISATLTNTRTYDGDVWIYQDYGNQYYDQCTLLAANAGASIITPYTIGLSGDNYWVATMHSCNVYHRIQGSGTDLGFDTQSSGQRSSTTRPCMVGYLSQPGQ